MASGRIRYHRPDPEAYKNATRDIVDRLLMDNAMDEVCVLDSVRDRLDPETYALVKRALDQIAARSRHIGQHLCELANTVDDRPKSTTIFLAEHM
jgi:hypothetical protein